MLCLTTELEKALKNDRIITRSSGSHGIWLSFLLPLAVNVGWLSNSDPTEAYKCCSIYSLNILLNVLYLLFHVFQYNSLNVTNKVNFVYGIHLLLIIYMYFYFLDLDFRKSFCYAISNGLMYFEALPFLLKVFPNSFTFGEVNVVTQGISLFIFSVFFTLNEIFSKGMPKNELDTCSIILLLALSWILIFCTVPYVIKRLREVKNFYCWGFFTLSMIHLSISYVLNLNLFLWTWLFFTKPERIAIVSLWIFCSALAIFLVQHHISVKKKSDTMIRKYFHVLIVMVYLSGIFSDINLLYFSSGCVFGLFIVLETFRLLRIPPLHNFLSAGFSIYCDEKDSGLLAVTPICLLVGHSIPLWLHHYKGHVKDLYLPLLSGVLSVGIGDTFASIGGKLFGRTMYKDSIKTVEGTVCCILSQIFFLQILNYLELIQMKGVLLWQSVMAICVTSVVEAKTNQIDNLILPLTMYTLLMMLG